MLIADLFTFNRQGSNRCIRSDNSEFCIKLSLPLYETLKDVLHSLPVLSMNIDKPETRIPIEIYCSTLSYLLISGVHIQHLRRQRVAHIAQPESGFNVFGNLNQALIAKLQFILQRLSLNQFRLYPLTHSGKGIT